MAAADAKLQSLIHGIEKLASAKLRREAIRVLGEEALSRVQDYFQRSAGPYGEQWAPPRHRPGGMPLVDTARLRNSLRTRAANAGFRITSNVAYAAIHNYGGPNMPKRQYLPDRARGTPPDWKRAFASLLTMMRDDALGR